MMYHDEYFAFKFLGDTFICFVEPNILFLRSS